MQLPNATGVQPVIDARIALALFIAGSIVVVRLHGFGVGVAAAAVLVAARTLGLPLRRGLFRLKGFAVAGGIILIVQPTLATAVVLARVAVGVVWAACLFAAVPTGAVAEAAAWWLGGYLPIGGHGRNAAVSGGRAGGRGRSAHDGHGGLQRLVAPLALSLSLVATTIRRLFPVVDRRRAALFVRGPVRSRWVNARLLVVGVVVGTIRTMADRGDALVARGVSLHRCPTPLSFRPLLSRRHALVVVAVAASATLALWLDQFTAAGLP